MTRKFRVELGRGEGKNDEKRHPANNHYTDSLKLLIVVGPGKEKTNNARPHLSAKWVVP